MKFNKEWHLHHKMPKNPTTEQRMAWHIEHARHCTCREMPASIKEAIRKKDKIFFTKVIYATG